MNEALRIDNILKLLRRGEWKLSGEEALAFHQSYEYLVLKHKELSAPKTEVVKELKDPITSVAVKPKGKKV